MKCLQLLGHGQCRVNEVTDPVPGEGEVRVRMRYSALCGSELHSYRHEHKKGGNGGHEAAGVIEALGPGVTTLQVGQRVGISAVAGCGQAACGYCQRGESTWCPRWKGRGNAHAELLVTSQTACLPLPDDVPDDLAVLLSGDALGVPYHSSLKLAHLRPMEGGAERPGGRLRVVIFGLGPVGLSNLMMQTFLGREVVAVDPSDWRRDYALKLGARQVINPTQEDPIAAVKTWTDGLGADVAFEAAGRPETLQACFKAVRTGGTVLINGEQGPVPLSPSDDFIRRDITAIGSWFYQVHEFPAMVALYRQGLPVRDLISHTFPFSEAPEAFRLFAAGLTAKVLLRY